MDDMQMLFDLFKIHLQEIIRTRKTAASDLYAYKEAKDSYKYFKKQASEELHDRTYTND